MHTGQPCRRSSELQLLGQRQVRERDPPDPARKLVVARDGLHELRCVHDDARALSQLEYDPPLRRGRIQQAEVGVDRLAKGAHHGPRVDQLAHVGGHGPPGPPSTDERRVAVPVVVPVDDALRAPLRLLERRRGRVVAQQTAQQQLPAPPCGHRPQRAGPPALRSWQALVLGRRPRGPVGRVARKPVDAGQVQAAAKHVLQCRHGVEEHMPDVVHRDVRHKT
eukprot:713100-Prymnesium_polylepis.2